MKKTCILTAAVMIVLVWAFSALAIHETQPSETQVVLPGADAGKVYEYITKSSPYFNWQLWPGKGTLYKGTEPHGALLTTYVNDTALKSIRRKSGMFYESIIVKENYSPEKKFEALTVMYKLKGYNPEEGDWFWAKYGPDGKVLAAGKTKACIECHSKKKTNDFIQTGPVK